MKKKFAAFLREEHSLRELAMTDAGKPAIDPLTVRWRYSGIRPETTCKRKIAMPVVMALSATLKAGQCQVPI